MANQKLNICFKIMLLCFESSALIFLGLPRSIIVSIKKKNLKIKKSNKNFIQEKFFDFESFFSSLKNFSN
ncbi:hypothetical protein BpHYR1_023335 [Brachionus plicatilis]|uniref:Uncharacterized protein n=1 Tax=Brachionus plicatilis TaxID=10195 RepID=A0A3M7SRX6_BRAPC|nr:hypothetical protein BpHYR1_023335 [Brachionus plicatilis]